MQILQEKDIHESLCKSKHQWWVYHSLCIQHSITRSFSHEFTAWLHTANLSRLSPASYDVCQDDSADNLNANKSGKTFRCNASGHYGEAEIQWKLGGQLLTNSPDTNITHTNTLDDQTGLYQLTSKLITKLSGTPACDVKAKGLSIVIRDDCTTMTGDCFYLFHITAPH